MDLQLHGHTALITGSSAGIGAAIAGALAAEGCRVVVHGRRESAATDVAAEVIAAGGQAEVVIGDVTDPGRLPQIANAAESAGVDIVVANAGPFAEHRWDDATAADWREALDGNVIATAALISALLPGLRRRGWGRVITIGSRASITPLPNMVEYSAAKAAVVNLTVSLAQHLAGSGVTANCVSPGVILTPSLQQMFMDRYPPGTQWSDVEAVLASEYAPNPVGRFGRAEEVADVVTFVASPRAGYLNGAVLRVDGGITGAA